MKRILSICLLGFVMFTVVGCDKAESLLGIEVRPIATPAIPEPTATLSAREKRKKEREETKRLEEQKALQEAEAGKWKTAYINYIEEVKITAQPDSYMLVDINSDDIPELFISFPYAAAGNTLCTYDGSKVNVLQKGQSAVSYNVNNNRILFSGGHMDAYFDEIYMIEKGQIVEVAHGSYGAEDNANIQIDEFGDPIYQYHWNDREVTAEEYDESLNVSFSPYGYTMDMSEAQVIECIQNWGKTDD